MRWSEDGSEVTLSAAEFAQQTEAFDVLTKKVKEYREIASRSNELLEEAIKKDATLRYSVDLKNSCERRAVAQAEVISAARSFFADMMNAFGGAKHPEDCPCSVCNCSKTRKDLMARSKNLYDGKPTGMEK